MSHLKLLVGSCRQSAGDIPAPPPPQLLPSTRITSSSMKDTLHFETAQWYHPRAPPRAGVAKWQTHRTQNATRKLVRVRIPLPAPQFFSPGISEENRILRGRL